MSNSGWRSICQKIAALWYDRSSNYVNYSCWLSEVRLKKRGALSGVFVFLQVNYLVWRWAFRSETFRTSYWSLTIVAWFYFLAHLRRLFRAWTSDGWSSANLIALINLLSVLISWEDWRFFLFGTFSASKPRRIYRWWIIWWKDEEDLAKALESPKKKTRSNLKMVRHNCVRKSIKRWLYSVEYQRNIQNMKKTPVCWSTLLIQHQMIKQVNHKRSYHTAEPT